MRRRTKSEIYFFCVLKTKIMSTEEKKWTQEELEAFLQEQWERDQERQEQEWEDEYEPSLSDDEEWADDEVLERKRRQIREEAREKWRRHDIEYYERQGFRLGKGGKLLEELKAWLPRKEDEWCEIRDQKPKEECEAIREVRARIKSQVASMDIREQKGRENWTMDDYYEWDGDREVLDDLRRDLYYLEMSDHWSDRQDMDEWLEKEWNHYLETKELMLRKTRSKDVTGMIMSFC